MPRRPLSAIPQQTDPEPPGVAQVLNYVADRGAWHAQADDLGLDDLAAFRSELRRAGGDRGLHIRTHLVSGTLIVEWPEWQPTPMQRAARARMVSSLFTDHPVSYDDALEQARREQIRPA